MTTQSDQFDFTQFTNLPQNSQHYYPYQQQTYPLHIMEMNMIYLMEQNRQLHVALLKLKQQNASQLIEIQNQKSAYVKLQNMKSSESSLQSKNSIPEISNNVVLKSQNTHKQIQRKKKKIKKVQIQNNQTKNIPKNYGKAIITFIESNKQLVRRVVSKFPSLTYTSFMALLKQKKKKINSIADLRTFWLEEEIQDFPKVARILSNFFLRYYSLEYIFNSRISNYTGHIKYRGRLVEAIKYPQHFTSIKQY